jgi:hypothetical protein
MRFISTVVALLWRVLSGGQDWCVRGCDRPVFGVLTALVLRLQTRCDRVFGAELAKALAQQMFDDDAAMIRFDMGEFKEEHSVTKLVGSPPGT